MRQLPTRPERSVPALALTEAEAGQAISVSERTMRDLIKAGEIQVVRIGKLVRVMPADLEAFLRRRRNGKGAPGQEGAE